MCNQIWNNTKRNGYIAHLQSESTKCPSLYKSSGGIASLYIIKVKPYKKGRLKRIIKAPKGYFLDPGLVSYLAGYNATELIPEDFRGILFESLILLNLKIYTALFGGEVYYWRTWGGKEKEVDFVLEAKRRLLGN